MRFGRSLLCAFITLAAPCTTVVNADLNGDRAVATVLGKKVLLKNVTPASAARKRKQLQPREYAKWLRSYRANLMLYAICGPVMKDYAVREKLKPTDEEITGIISSIAREHARVDPKNKQELQKFGMRVFWLNGASRDWRNARALHEKYGGRVGISSFGACTAIDGLNAVLRQYAKQGNLVFHDSDLEQAFWEKAEGAPFTDVVLRPERVPQHFKTAPWERWRNELIKLTKQNPKPQDMQH